MTYEIDLPPMNSSLGLQNYYGIFPSALLLFFYVPRYTICTGQTCLMLNTSLLYFLFVKLDMFKSWLILGVTLFFLELILKRDLNTGVIIEHRSKLFFVCCLRDFGEPAFRNPPNRINCVKKLKHMTGQDWSAFRPQPSGIGLGHISGP